MQVRIGLSDAAREIEVDIDDIEAFVTSAEEAMKAVGEILWVTDTEDHRVGIPAQRIAYIDISPESRRSAGF